MEFDQIWAPWRLGYILGDKTSPEPEKPLELLGDADPECFLCQCAADKVTRERLTIHRGDRVVTVMNRYPYNNGHLLISPLEHRGRLHELDDDVQVEMSRTINRMIDLLQQVMSPDGFNVGLNLGSAAGAGVPGHLHWHIVPRWSGDTNFMPSIAGINCIPQSLEATWQLLTETLRREEN